MMPFSSHSSSCLLQGEFPEGSEGSGSEEEADSGQ